MEVNKEKRKQIPLYSGLLKYFPDALCEVAKVSYIGSKQHHPNEPLHWDRNKSTDDLDALMRHLIESGKTDVDGILHTAKVAWRALAHLQKELESKNVRSQQWHEDQYNRNRLPEDQIISGTE